jgi:hypothetical protein
MTQPPYPPQQPWGRPAPGPNDPAGAGPRNQPSPPQQPQYGQPQYGQPQYGQPQYGQPQYGQPQYGQPQQQYGSAPEYPQPAPAKPNGRGKLIAGVAALVVLAGGGVATYAAFSDSSDNQAGASSPKAAVQKLVADLNNADLLGVLDDLAPAEKRALADPIREDISTLKRLHVLSTSADPNKVSAVQFQASGVSYAAKTITVNESVQVVTVTGGTLRVSADAAKIPLTSQFLHAAFPGGAPSGTSTATTDLATLAEHGGRPLQVAVQKVDGRWYPSLFYTIAQNAAAAAHAGAPTPSDRIAAAGAATPDDAVKGLLLAATKGDWRRVIELTSPTEMAVLHDYGSLVLQNAPSSGTAGFTIDEVRFASKDISGGKRLTATSMAGQAGGRQFSVTMDGDCYQVSIAGDQRKLCGSDLIGQIAAAAGRGNLTDAQRTALTHLMHGVTQFGMDVSQSDGKWYVDPVRTVADEFGTALASLQGNDVLELITLFR